MDNKIIVAIVAVAVVAVIGTGAAFSLGSASGDSKNAVTYDGNGGLYEGKSTYELSNDTVQKCLFTKDGYAFVKWNTKSDGTGKDYFENDPVSKGTTLYAQWEKGTAQLWYIPSTVSDNFYIYLGSTIDGTAVDITDGCDRAIPRDAAILIMPNPDKGACTASVVEGRAYLAFDSKGVLVRLSVSGATEGELVVSGNCVGMTIEPTDNTVTLSVSFLSASTKYYSNAGGESSTVNKGSLTTATIDAIGFTNPGHTFLSWNTAADGSGTTYAPGSELPNPGIRLYAQWSS